MTSNDTRPSAEDLIANASSAASFIYGNVAPERDPQEAIAWGLAALAQSNAAIAAAILETRGSDD